MTANANAKACAAGSMPIFIKSLRPGASNKMQQDFQREIQLMSELLHPNLLNLIGVCMHDHPWCMLFEYVQFGHLHEFLILHSPTQSDNLSYSDDNTVTSLLQASRKTLTFADQVHIAKEVASGMEFLASRRFVHRDLAARNVLIGHNLSCKICDFGIAVDTYSCDYYKVQGGAVLLPVRWMAPEAVAHNRFSLETDVFSYGVLLWEIFSYGMQPYFGYSNAEVIEMVKNHQILPCPDECPVRMYALMVECWNLVPAQRPHFRDISARLRAWLAELDGLNGHDRLGLAQPIPQYYLQGTPGPLERFISIQHTSSTAAGASASALTQEALERLNAITKAEYGGQPHFQLANNNDVDMPNAYSPYTRELPSQSDAVLYLQPDAGRVALMPATQRGLTAQSAASSGALHYTRQSSAEADSMRRPTYQHAQSVTGATVTEHVSSSRYSRKSISNAKHQQPMSATPFQQQQLQPNSPPIVIEKHSSSSLINRNNLIYPQSVSEQHRKRNSSASSHRSSSQKGAEYASFAGTQTQMPYPSSFAASSTGGIRNPLDNHPLPSPSAVALYIPLSHTAARPRTEPDSD